METGFSTNGSHARRGNRNSSAVAPPAPIQTANNHEARNLPWCCGWMTTPANPTSASANAALPPGGKAFSRKSPDREQQEGQHRGPRCGAESFGKGTPVKDDASDRVEAVVALAGPTNQTKADSRFDKRNEIKIGAECQ